MDFKSVALVMYPYWIMGAFMIWATAAAGYGKLVRIDPKAITKWVIFLMLITLFRVILLQFLFEVESYKKAAEAVTIIPWQSVFMVYWEDACFGLPLLLLHSCFRNSKLLMPFWYAMVAMLTLSFGSGHTYQGYLPAILLMFYIPYSISLGRKYGFGTVMVGHVLYDLFTILTVKWSLGLL
jgi:hypothetical protein